MANAPEIYATSFYVISNPYGFSIALGEHAQAPVEKEPKAIVKMPALAAKELMIVLRTHLRKLDDEGTKVKVRTEWLEKIGVAYEDREDWW